jgi:hypothetical protein
MSAMAPSVTAWTHTAFPELRADRPTINLATTAARDPNRSSSKTGGPSGKPVLKGSIIGAFETCHPIDTAPPVGEKMLLPHD